mgnify:CR=1 FL=1
MSGKIISLVRSTDPPNIFHPLYGVNLGRLNQLTNKYISYLNTNDNKQVI